MSPPRKRSRGNSARRRSQKATLIAKYGAVCGWCKGLFAPAELTVDHVVPLARGGTNALTNKCLACGPCNARKADSAPHENWRQA